MVHRSHRRQDHEAVDEGAKIEVANGPSMSAQLPDEARLRQLAGDRAFARGEGYSRDGRIALSEVSGSVVSGEAFGTETYRFRLERRNGDWHWHCDCPAADDGSFCKHLVAAVLTAYRDRDDEDESEVAPQSGRQARTAEPDDLSQFLKMQPAERLAGWLHRLALQNRDVERQLLLYRAASQPGLMKAALAKVLATGGFLDYRRTMDYASRLDAAIEQLRDLLQRDPDECRILCEYAMKRLFKLVERCDDSAGALGDRMHEIADLHAQACVAAPPGKPLAKILHALQRLDDWNMLPLARYWDALDPQGQATYSRLVMNEYDNLPPPVPRAFDHTGFGVCRRVEALARCSGDFELLQRILRRDLSGAHQHLRVLESLREFGRAREAMAWAESAVKRFPDDDRLRAALAECLAEAGMQDEALEQDWLRFRQRPIPACWDALKRRAGAAWSSSWRERALVIAEERENGQASLRVELLTHDGDLEAAVALARSHPVMPGYLLALASRVKRNDPAAAGSFYLRVAKLQAKQLSGPRDYKSLVESLVQTSKLLSPSEWRPLVTEVRAGHARKSKLMAMLDKAGL